MKTELWFVHVSNGPDHGHGPCMWGCSEEIPK